MLYVCTKIYRKISNDCSINQNLKMDNNVVQISVQFKIKI